MGNTGGSADIMESVYLTLFLDHLKLRNFLRLVKNAANSRCLSGYVNLSTLRESVGEWIYSIFCVRPLQVCSFN